MQDALDAQLPDWEPAALENVKGFCNSCAGNADIISMRFVKNYAGGQIRPQIYFMDQDAKRSIALSTWEKSFGKQ